MTVRRIVQEIHRRSLWQVLVIYLGGSWVVIQAVDLIARHLVLPSWIPTLALVLVLVGLPIVLATAFVQEGPEGPLEGAKRVAHGGGAATAAPVSAAEATAGPSPGLRRWLTWRNALTGAVGAFALWGVVAAAWIAFSDRDRDRGGESKIGRIAVLPLDDLSADTARGYFADAMTEELITELAQIKELLVISRSAVMGYRDHPVPIRQVARDLGVDAVIEGSVVRSGDEVRITAQLIDGRSEAHLWARDYTRDFRDLLALQKDVAREIARAIEVKLTPREQMRLTEARSVDPRAQEAYLQGVQLQRRFRQGSASRATIEQSIALLERAVAIEPSWADARAELARAYHWKASAFGVDTTAYRKSKDAALEAIRLDPSSAGGHAALAFVLSHYDVDWAGAEQEYRRALELAPNDNYYHWGYGLFQLAAGRYDQAVLSLRQALERDPLSLYLNMQLASALACAGRADDARATITRLLDGQPEEAWVRRELGEIDLLEGDRERAIGELERAVDMSRRNATIVGSLAYAYASEGREEEARELLPELEAEGAWIPAVYAALGDLDRAVAQLREGYRQRRTHILDLRCFPDAGFADLGEVGGLARQAGYRALLDEIDFPRS